MHKDKILNKANPEMKENINLENIKHNRKNTKTDNKSLSIAIDKIKMSNTEPIMTVSSVKQPSEEYRCRIKPEPKYLERENSILIQTYGNDTYNYMKMLESDTISPYFISRSRVSEVRTKMIDWMIEVLSVFNCEENIFFLAAHLMDMYIYKSASQVRADDIHLLGVASMFVASKFEDLVPLRMDTVVKKIGHGAFQA
jgi:hypothetical protein